MTNNKTPNMEKLFEKMVAGLEILAKSQTTLNARLSQIEKSMIAKDVPPQMDTSNVEGAAEGFNPQADGADADDDDNFPAKEAATKPTSPTTSGQEVPPHNMAKARNRKTIPAKPVQKGFDAERLIAKAVSETNKVWESKLPELIKAHTPMPYAMSMSPEAQLAAKNPFEFIRKAIAVDREVSGGAYTVEEGRFGFKTGNGDMNARTETAKFLRKALN